MLTGPTEDAGPLGQWTDRPAGHPAAPSGLHPAIREGEAQLADTPLVVDVDGAGAWDEDRHPFRDGVIDHEIRVPHGAPYGIGQGEHQRTGRRFRSQRCACLPSPVLPHRASR
jgi:hypothetical protein